MTFAMNRSKLQSLLSLLDDPDDNIAVTVMSELLKNESELMALLAELQESDNKVLRKRVQQLETIITLRKRRREFAKKITPPVKVVEALTELHLLYHERDVPEVVYSMVEMFVRIACNNNIETIDDIGTFMARNNFTMTMPEDKPVPEDYCIGSVLNDRMGSDIMLCLLAKLIGVHAKIKVALVRLDDMFAVCTPDGRFIAPANNWVPEEMNGQALDIRWNDSGNLLKYISLMLFLHTVSSDNFHYVHTVAQALCGGDDDFSTDFLPYPYNGKKNKKLKERESLL